MKKNLFLVILFFVFSQLCFAQNLITNPSFEDSSGYASLNNWAGWPATYSSPFVDSSSYIPIGGGNWSLRLRYVDVFPPNFVIQFITGMQGTFVYSFSVFAKVDTMLRIDPSYIEIGLVIDTAPICGVAGYPCLNQKKIYDSIPAVWSKITLIDTITSNASDSIAVVLSAGALPVGILVYYDLAELTVTDTLALSENIELMPMPAIKVTPNPFNDHTIIEFNNKPYSLIQFTLFSMSGQIIRQITTSTGKINLERSDLSSGMYFYQALDYHTKELRGRGKIILQE